MKGKFLALAMMCLSTTLTSCFKDEPLNAECDIEQAYIHVDNPEAMFFSKNDTLQRCFTQKTRSTLTCEEAPTCLRSHHVS